MNAYTLKLINWSFIRGDNQEYSNPDYQESPAWQKVYVPHDWAIEGPFDKDNDAYSTKIIQNGETKETMHYGRTGGLPHIGIAWYRTSFVMEQTTEEQHHFLEFDGVMSHATVFVNGKELAHRPFGYASFQVDFSDVARYGTDNPNVIAVRVENPPQMSRWYPGAGIIRDVRYCRKGASFFVYNGISLQTRAFDPVAKTATLKIDCEAVNAEPCILKVTFARLMKNAESETIELDGLSGTWDLNAIEPWSPESPALYMITLSLMQNEQVMDEVSMSYGFRNIEFDATTGMKLNGKPYHLKGVCLHHDHGPAGAAFNSNLMRQQLKQLKSIGCNAIRTSHNPPAPPLLTFCDLLGLMVMDEAFDSWELCKCTNDYSRHFKEWHQRDLVDFIKRDRNHPSVIFWSIGNEINEQSSNDGLRVAQELADICHQTDPTRPVAAGLDRPDGAIQNGLPTALDLIGWNYKPHRYQELHNVYPDKPQFGSETASTVSTRGEYFFPVSDGQGWKQRPDSIQCSSYDREFPPWATTPDKEFVGQDTCPWIFGEFVWTGFDYLGEPTPFDEKWPAHSSYFGIFDLIGEPKDRAFLYAARWSTQKILHIVPHWTWPGREGQVTPVQVYTNYDKVELFLNGVSQGIRTREPSSYRLRWDDVIYEPGLLEAVALGQHDEKLLTSAVATAKTPAKIILKAACSDLFVFDDTPETTVVHAHILDSKGDIHPLCNSSVTFEVSGAGELLAVGNGDPTCTESFKGKTISAFHGCCAAYIRTLPRGGRIKITAKINGLPLAKYCITAHDMQ